MTSTLPPPSDSDLATMTIPVQSRTETILKFLESSSRGWTLEESDLSWLEEAE